MALNSPGAEITVVDESFYTLAEPGTIPLIIVASAENKINGSGTGIAPGTLKSTAGQVYTITSPKELVETFGDPIFKTDTNNNPIHAGEQNEYGLQAAYSFLGVKNRAYVVRADIDLAQLSASSTPPAAKPNNGTYWLDTQSTRWGIFEWNSEPVTVPGGQTFTNKVPLVITDPDQVHESGAPIASVGRNGNYAIVTMPKQAGMIQGELTAQHPMTVWFKNNTGTWVQVGTEAWAASWTGDVQLEVSRHTKVPQWKLSSATPAATGSVWVKTTDPNLGASWAAKRYNSATQLFESINAPIFDSSAEALYSLDRTGGGANLPVGALFTDFNIDPETGGLSFVIFRRKNAAPTAVRSGKILPTTFGGDGGGLLSASQSSISGNIALSGSLSKVNTIAGTAVGGVVSHAATLSGTGSTNGTYSNVSIQSTGPGTGAKANVTYTGSNAPYTASNTTIVIADPGTGYRVNDQLKILGSSLGGVDGTNDLSFVVSSVSGGTYTAVAITATSGSGTGAVATVTIPEITGQSWPASAVVTITSSGSGFKVNDTLKITGNLLGGVTGTNDLTCRVSEIEVVGSYLGGTDGNNNPLGLEILSAGTGPTVGLGSRATVVFNGKFNGAYSATNTTITVVSAGQNYEVGDQLRILGSLIGGVDGTNDLVFTVGAERSSYEFVIAHTNQGDLGLSEDYLVSFNIDGTNAAANANAIVEAIGNALGNDSPVGAVVDSQNRVVITHDNGGDIHLRSITAGVLEKMGFSVYVPATATAPASGTANLYADPDGLHDYVASSWEPLTYVASADAPTSLTDDGAIWYDSVFSEVDILINDGEKWVGYHSPTSPVYENNTDPTGPIVSATTPTTQRDGVSPLQTGDLWIDTSDIENFPVLHRYNKDFLRWVLVDTSDQSTEDGIIFADARYNVSGASSAQPGDIEVMMSSDYVDPDCPDPALYPRGMLLWNLRRSGFNVKQFRQNYIDINAKNSAYGSESMTEYYPHRWVTISANQENGAGTFGRRAQRSVVVRALQALVNSNQDIRDDQSRQFNLVACPGYPELIGEMRAMNYDRGITTFIVGDTPARLAPDSTSLQTWGSNLRMANEDNDFGAATYDEYLGLFYPWGFTSDNFGNNIVVPPSHMMLRTIALSDQVSYPWFPAAGLRRGGITNASAVGYVDSQEGEFRAIALSRGQEGVLQSVKINPIVYVTGAGLINNGQLTRAKAASSRDRMNVIRLELHLRSQLSKLVKPYIHEPNDKITRDELKGAIESLLLELAGQRALYDYLVVCDESNNTPARIDRNELWVDIAVEPVKSVEFIYIPLRLKNTGEISGI